MLGLHFRQFEEYVARVPSTLVRTVWDVNIMTRMEDRLFKMDERGKIVNVKWMFLLLDLMSTVQREAIERMKRSQVVEQNNDKEDEAIVQGAGVGRHIRSLDRGDGQVERDRLKDAMVV